MQKVCQVDSNCHVVFHLKALQFHKQLNKYTRNSKCRDVLFGVICRKPCSKFQIAREWLQLARFRMLTTFTQTSY